MAWRLVVLWLAANSPPVAACESCANKSPVATVQASEAGGLGSGTFDPGQSDSVLGFFRHLFSSDFMPHGHCYWWRPEIVWLHVISDALIALAYFSIPLMLVFFIRKRKDLPFHGMFAMFAAFILWCGATHLLRIWTLWLPIYRFEGVVKGITAGISVVTACLLFPLIPQALSLRSPKELEAKNRALEEANLRISESEKLKGEILANVSHELRTPLTLILSPLETLMSKVLLTAERSSLQSIHNNAVRLLQLVTSLLDLSKLQEGRMQAHLAPLEVVELTKSVLADFRGALENKSLKVVFEPSEGAMPVMMDRYLFERILFNLLANAVKFTPEGGNIGVTLRRKEDRLCLLVKDSGIGISQADQGVIFQRFRQIEGTPTRRFEGSGLGLALVKDFAELLGGTVTVKSASGEGSEFKVEILAPAVKESPTEFSSEASPAPARPKVYVPLKSEWVEAPSVDDTSSERPKILIVEDNAELATYLASLLRENYRTRVAPDGELGLRMVREWSPSLVISDVMMPKMDGLDLCRAIKADAASADIPVILVTAQTHREALIKGWEAGADEYLFKPFHEAELLTRVKTVLVTAQQRLDIRAEKRRIEDLQEFSYIASHDLKEPLRTIRTFGQLLQSRYSEKLDETGREYVGYMVQSAGRMHALVHDLSMYASLDSEEDLTGSVDTAALLTQVSRDLDVIVRESGAEIIWGGLPKVSGSETRLALLFQNLIANSIKFRGAEPLRVHIAAERQEDQWLFSVKDNGLGFEPQYADWIFVIFKRFHDNQKYPGTGTGLAICKRIVEQHGGKIWAESKGYGGATVYFTLPCRAE